MKTYFSVPAVALLVSAAGIAITIVQTDRVGLTDVGSQFAVPVEFNPFNPALGTLTGVTLDLGASFAGTVGVENLSGNPDMAEGVIAGSVTIANNGGSLTAEVFPSAISPLRDLSAFDGVLDYAGTSGFTDSVSGATATTSAISAMSPVLESFSGSSEIFLTLTAKSFPLVEGMETEAAEETANASATVQLTYDYTPVAPVPEPETVALLAIGIPGTLSIYRRRYR